jgi:oligosaccharide reducing-end xylanase
LQPPPSEGAAVSGKYRNLFVELGKPADEVEQKLERAYQSLFHGDPANESVMFEAGHNDSGKLAYILDINNGDVRSEGMSYGMMIAVQHNQKEDFDALWNWAKTFMYHADPTHPAYGYFSWQMHPDGSAMDEMPAADGEEYFATALLFAEHRFGGGEGMYAYGEQATKLLSDMKNRAAIEGTVNGGRKTKGVALWNPEQKMVRFTPDSGNFESNGDHTDPSYHLPAFYELWARWGPQADRPFWADAAKVSRDYFVEVTNPKTGLAPDYGNFDGSPKAASWDAHTIDFRYDAWRTAMNWSVDAAWWAKDPRENELSNKLLRFFRSVGKVYPNTYRLDGTPTSQSSSSGLSAMNAVAALAATDPVASQYVEALWQQPIPTGKYRYYDGMLHLLAMLHVSGEFRVYGSVQ